MVSLWPTLRPMGRRSNMSMRTRRQFAAALGSAAAWPFAASGQQATRRIGVLIGYAENDPEIQARVATFRQALDRSGWAEGRNVRIDYRFAPASPDQAQAFAK